MTIDYSAHEIFYFVMIVTLDHDTMLQEATSYNTELKNTVRYISFPWVQGQDFLLISVLLIPLTYICSLNGTLGHQLN